jgi:hypothetical protein
VLQNDVDLIEIIVFSPFFLASGLFTFAVTSGVCLPEFFKALVCDFG